ncbi:tetratricopeptide repeat protein [Amycolatopsis sp. NPDC005961]|uniref:tetratricopeptide repeat protein n=1 Tax=Amycolatopsis sp. NPDC005961 TaxID=3156720 RepID=UPI003405E332
MTDDPIPGFRARLRQLRVEVGNPSYAALDAAAGQATGSRLAKQTTKDLLTGSGLPRWTTVEKFVRACKRCATSQKLGVPVDVSRWKDEYDRARPTPADTDGPLRQPYRAADTAETPVRLLRAEYAVVPFAGRDELTVLLDWCRQVAGGDRTGVAVVCGVGGAGKTRLALELAHLLHIEKWSTGVLPKDTDPGPLSAVTGPLLVVLDYADGRVQDAIALMKVLRMRPGPPAVVMLTARSSGGQWLTDIIGSLDDDRHAYRREEIDLPDHHPNPRDIYARTVAALRTDGQSRLVLPQPAAETRWTTLDLVLLGWIAAAGATSLPATREELYDEVLRHEENYWCTVYTRFRTDVAPDRALLRRAAACVSLVTPPEEAIDTVLTAMTDLAEDPTERRTVRRTLQTCLSSAPGEGLAVRPDPVADHLLRELLRDDALVHRAVTRAGEDQLEVALLAMDRANQDIPDAVTDLLVTLVDADPSRWRAVLVVAAKRAGVALRALTRLADRPNNPLPLDELSAAIPSSSPSLFELGLIVDERRLDVARTAADEELTRRLIDVHHRAMKAGDLPRALSCVVEAVDRLRDLAAEDPATYLVQLAGALNNRGAILTNLGRHEEAVEPIQEASGILGELADPAARSQFALSMANLGHLSSMLGRHDDAAWYCHEAVELLQDLAACDPAEYRAKLAASTQILASVWSRMGQFDKALACSAEALAIRRSMVADAPHYLPELAEALSNVGAMLLRTGRYAEALEHCAETVQLYRELAASNPASYRPGLALSLYNLGGVFTKLGRAEVALDHNLESVRIYRELSSRIPAIHQPDFAMSLNNLASAFLGIKDYERASLTSREAVANYRYLARRSTAWQPGLAMSLSTLGAVLIGMDSHDEGIATLQEAVTLYRRLATENRDHRADLASALHNIAAVLPLMADPQSSLEYSQEAVDLFRALVADNPTAYRPELAGALRNHSDTLIKLRAFEQALPASQEAVELYRQLTANDATAYRPNLAAALHNLGTSLSESGRHAEALPSCQEAVDLRRTLADRDPTTGLLPFIESTHLLGTVALRVGWSDMALDHSRSAAECYRQFADIDPAAYLPNLAGALHNVALALCQLGRDDEAVAPARTVVDLFRRLATENGAEHLPDLARALNNLGARLATLGHFEQALDPVQEAAGIRRRLAADNPAHLPDVAASLSNLGVLLAETDQHDRALEHSSEAVLLFRRLADEYLPYRLGLATSLSRTSSVLSSLNQHGQALAYAKEAAGLHLEAVLVDPLAHLPELLSSLRKLTAVDTSRTAWAEVLAEVADSHARAVLRTELARCSSPDQARREIQLAAQEAAVPPEIVSLALAGVARQTVRTAVLDLDFDLDNLPGWATTALPDAHLELLGALRAATNWPALRAVLHEHRDTVESSKLTATVDTYQALHPTDPAPRALRRLLDEIRTHGYDTYVSMQETFNTHVRLLNDWTDATSWTRSAEFFRENQEALTDPELARTLSTNDSAVARQHLGIIQLATTETVDHAYAIATDPAIAEEAVFDAIESGDTNRLSAIAAAAPDLRAHATTWSLLSAVLCLTDHNLDEATSLGRQIAEQGSPILRRAHAVRLRSFGTHNPRTAGVQGLVTIIDPTDTA